MSLTVLAAENVDRARDMPVNHWIIGLIVFLILTVMMLGVLSFGKGREHT